jgi:hypothetical protein
VLPAVPHAHLVYPMLTGHTRAYETRPELGWQAAADRGGVGKGGPLGSGDRAFTPIPLGR